MAAGVPPRILSTEEVTGLIAEIPEGHRHLRTTLNFADGTSLTLQEASVAAIVRAYTVIKTDPVRTKVVMHGQALSASKSGYAEWQLLEED